MGAWRIVSELTTDVVTYCTEASNQKSKYAYRKILFYKKKHCLSATRAYIQCLQITTKNLQNNQLN